MNIIEVEELSRNVGQLVAVDKVSFQVAEGEIFGFLGPNGAGKTTTINMLCTLLNNYPRAVAGEQKGVVIKLIAVLNRCAVYLG